MLMEGILLYYQCVKAVSSNVNFNLVTGKIQTKLLQKDAFV